jgi:hypothetical protein
MTDNKYLAGEDTRFQVRGRELKKIAPTGGRIKNI